MPTRKDQLQAYQFMMRRVTSALIVHETDPEQTPLRRGVGAVFAGVMIAVLVAAGFGIYGIFTGMGGNSWRQDGTVIIEKETGATYVYSGEALQPVLNVVSGKLLSSGQNQGAEPKRVSGADLADMPRKPMVGIAGAPASLPPADRVTGAPWTMCSVGGEDMAGSPTTSTTLMVGDRLADGVPLGSNGLLVRDAEDGSPYLIWNNHRYRIAGDRPDAVVRSVFGAQTAVMDVGTAMLNGLPVGQDIGPIQVEGRGDSSTVVSGFQVGDIVFHPVGGGEQYYLVRGDGLAPITDLQTRILRGQYSVEPKEISASVANSAPTSNALAPAQGEAAPPPVVPPLAAPDNGTGSALCASTSNARSAPEITLGGDTSALVHGIGTTSETEAGTKLADQVLVPPGHVSVVRSMPSTGQGAGAFAIVTDVGLRYPVPSPDVLAALGYSAESAIDMPAALVQRIPAGPTLSPEAAMQTAPALP
ncbi:type VII secretion protein EccB [Saccharomonospora sp. NPDC006951]